MKTTIKVENIRCGGCSNSIHKALASVTGIFGVEVDIANSTITVEHTDEVSRKQITDKLLSLGYPEEGTTKGFEALKAGATSFVSCAIGKIKK